MSWSERMRSDATTWKGNSAARFFLANRAWLVHIDAVARCRPWGKGKLLLSLGPPVENEIVVSHERAAAFRSWLGE